MDAPVLGPEVDLPLEPGVGAYDEAARAVLGGGAGTRALAVVSRARHTQAPGPAPRDSGDTPAMKGR